MSLDKMSTDEKIKKPFIKPDIVPEPHFIPGYTGHCPDLPRVIGASYGRVTNKILKEYPIIAGRLSPMIATVQPPVRNNQLETIVMEKDKKLINSRTPKMGRRVFNDYMMPGYTGHVPYIHEAVGVNFTKGCVSSISKFIREQDDMDRKSEKKNFAGVS